MTFTLRQLRHPARVLTLWALFVGLSAVWIVGDSVPAGSHNAVLSTTPEAGSTVGESPVEVHIVTSDQLLDLGGTGSGFAIVVRDENGHYYGDGCVTIGASDMSTVAMLGASGDYTVTYQFVSADGHSLSDSFSFTFQPTESHTPAEGISEAPVCGGVLEPAGDAVDETTDTDLTNAPDGVVADPIDENFSAEESQPATATIIVATMLVVASIAVFVWLVVRRIRG